MNMLLKISLRNVFRNGRRTTINILMIGSAIAAIVVFKGFSHHMMWRAEEVATSTQYGHIQVASERTWNLSAADRPKDRLILVTPEMKQKIEALPQVDYVSSRLSFFGLVNTGDQSMSARGMGFDPAVEVKMRDQLTILEGRNLSPNSKFEVLLGAGLAQQLAVKVGSTLTLLSYTFDGTVNAIDAECVGVFKSGLAEVDSTTFMIPLATAQKLMDTNSVERMVVQLKDSGETDNVRRAIASTTPKDIGVRSWLDLADYYRQISNYLTKQNRVIDWILMVLALLAIANTVGMSIAERIGEIGTLRALGDTRRQIVTQFLIEGLILGLIGGVFGTVFGIGLAKFLTYLRIEIMPPGASYTVPVVVDLVPSAFIEATLMMCFMAVFASFLPAYRGANLKIVEALRRNI